MLIQAKPFAFEFKPSAAALVIIDMQRDFLEAGGFGETLGNDVSQLRPAIPVVKKVLQAFRKEGLCVVHTREGHSPDLSDCPPAKRDRGNPKLRIGDPGPMGRVLVQGELGHATVDELAPIQGEVVIDKPGKGAFYNTPLALELEKRSITQLVFTGVTTEVCVQTTMREANDRGYECLLLEDGTASYFPEFKTQAIAMMTAQGAIVGWSCESSLVLGALESASQGHV